MRTNNYTYTNASGAKIDIRTERYGVFGFNIFVTVESMGIKEQKANLFQNNGEWLLGLGIIGKRNIMVRPDANVLQAMLKDKKAPTEEQMQYEEERRKERAYDDLYNEGGEGFNPYRSESDKDNTPQYKEDNF